MTKISKDMFAVWDPFQKRSESINIECWLPYETYERKVALFTSYADATHTRTAQPQASILEFCL